MGEIVTNVAGQSDSDPKTGNGNTTKRRRANHSEPASAETGNTGTGAEAIRIVGEEGQGLAGIPPVAKPKRKRPARKKPTPKLTAANDPMIGVMFTSLVSTIFGLTSMKAGDHWQLSTEEAQQLADPTLRILERYGLLEKIAASSDAIALMLAASAIVVPRAVFSVQLAKHNNLMKRESSPYVGNENQVRTAAPTNPEAGTVPQHDQPVANVDAGRTNADIAKDYAGPGVVEN